MASQPDETVPAARAITVRDLLTFRMGFGSVMAMTDTAHDGFAGASEGIHRLLDTGVWGDGTSTEVSGGGCAYALSFASVHPFLRRYIRTQSRYDLF